MNAIQSLNCAEHLNVLVRRAQVPTERVCLHTVITETAAAAADPGPGCGRRLQCRPMSKHQALFFGGPLSNWKTEHAKCYEVCTLHGGKVWSGFCVGGGIPPPLDLRECRTLFGGELGDQHSRVSEVNDTSLACFGREANTTKMNTNFQILSHSGWICSRSVSVPYFKTAPHSNESVSAGSQCTLLPQ